MDGPCGYCGQSGQGLRRCTGCYYVGYCSSQCQTRHWPRHKVMCLKRHSSTSRQSVKNTTKETKKTPLSTQNAPSKTEQDRKDKNSKDRNDCKDKKDGTRGQESKSDSVGVYVCKTCKTKSSTAVRCDLCQDVTYCSRDCRRADWSVHTVTCSASTNSSSDNRNSTNKTDSEVKIADKKPELLQGHRKNALGNEADPATTVATSTTIASTTARTTATATAAATVTNIPAATTATSTSTTTAATTTTSTAAPTATAIPAVSEADATGSSVNAASDATSATTVPTAANTAEGGSSVDAAADADPTAKIATGKPETDAKAEEEALKICQTCKTKQKTMKRCGRCQGVTYCSRDCQSADWPSHKVTCTEIEVLTTEGYKEMEKREEEEARRRAVRLHPRTSPSFEDRLAMRWREAKSRAARAFFGHRIVDTFSELDNDVFAMPFGPFNPFTGMGLGMGVAFVGRLTTMYFHPFRHARRLEDITGRSLYVIFYTEDLPWPFFSYSQFREGNFICIRGAFLHVFVDGTVGFRIEDPADVRIFDPSS